MATKLDLSDIILNYDPEAPQERFRALGLEAARESRGARLPRPVPWPHSPPTATLLHPTPKATDSLARFAGYDAIVMTWTSAEAAALAALFTPNYPLSDWYEYRHGVSKYIPLVTGDDAPFNDDEPDMARYYHSLGLYFPCTVGTAKVLLFKSGLHFAYDGPKTPLKTLVTELVDTIKPKILITTGTAGGIGRTTALGDVAIGPSVRFDCTTQFKSEPWADASYNASATAPGAVAEITPALLKVNSVNLPGSPVPTIWNGAADVVVTTDFFGFDDSTDYYKLEGLGRVCEMGDAMVAQAVQTFPNVRWYSIRNASDPQIANPDNNIEAAKEQAGNIYAKYGPFTTAGSAIATWAVLSTSLGD
jgi:nucleoside phosphorylase